MQPGLLIYFFMVYSHLFELYSNTYVFSGIDDPLSEFPVVHVLSGEIVIIPDLLLVVMTSYRN